MRVLYCSQICNAFMKFVLCLCPHDRVACVHVSPSFEMSSLAAVVQHARCFCSICHGTIDVSSSCCYVLRSLFVSFRFEHSFMAVRMEKLVFRMEQCFLGCNSRAVEGTLLLIGSVSLDIHFRIFL